jgi:hypothetical protein
VSDEKVKALGEIEGDKSRVAGAYNKRVKEKSFQVGDLVWKTILLLGLEVTSSGSGLQIGKDRIESRKQFQEILIWFRAYKGPRRQWHLMGST